MDSVKVDKTLQKRLHNKESETVEGTSQEASSSESVGSVTGCDLWDTGHYRRFLGPKTSWSILFSPVVLSEAVMG